MFDYFLEYYLGMAQGISYVPAQITTIFAVIFLLNDTQWTARGILRKLGECTAWFAAVLAVTSVVYWRFGDHQLDKIMLVLFTVVYACFFQSTRRGSAWFAVWCTWRDIWLRFPSQSLLA